MKRLFFLLLLSFFSVAYSQQSKNRFDQDDNTNPTTERPVQNTNNQNVYEPEADGPTDPPAPLPIDNYIPFLLITAVAFIIYQTKKQKKLS